MGETIMGMPQLPPGFVLDNNIPPLPSGFVLDEPEDRKSGKRAFSIGAQGQSTEIPVPQKQPKSPLFQNILESIIPRGGLIDPKSVLGSAEVAATVGSGAIAEPVSGIAGLTQLADPEKAAQTVESVQQKLTRLPKSEYGQQSLENISALMNLLPDISKKIGDYTLERTESPIAATIASTTPTIIGELLGLKGLKSMRKGTQLLDDIGQPTKVLRKELNKKRLNFDLLEKTAKEGIPEKIEPGLLFTKQPSKIAKNAMVEQIKAGGKDDALAGFKVDGNKLKKDVVANKAIKQGFKPGIVQSMKTATPATKEKALKMSKMMQKIKGQEGLGLEFRPSDVIGDSVTDRVTFIRDKADTARIELDTIANDKLSGQPINTGGVLNTLDEALADLDVSLVSPKSGGKPTPDFNLSLISKDKSSQKVIKDLLDLMAEGGEPDALRLHKMKKQLDMMIDFKKKSALGLSDAGKKVLKKVRRSLNDTLRATNPDYAKVNDTLSGSITALEDLDKAVGTVDIIGPGANKAIGQKMAALQSNQQGRIPLENAIDGIERTVDMLGGKFDDNIKELVMLSSELDNKFGTTAKTSFGGRTTQAYEDAANRMKTHPSKATIAREGVAVAGKGLEKIRGINDFNAFEALNELLSRKKK